VSHHGDFVVLASEPNSLVGIDVMVTDVEDIEAPEEYVKNFRSCFTLLEWTNINSVGPDKRQLLDQFNR
jgi:4'-phosphopantetheinyl transferase